MKSRMILSGILMLVTLSGCTGPNTVARNVETAASINSLAGVPGAGWVGLAASVADVFSRVGKPKVGGTTERLSTLVSKTPSIFWDSSGSYKWGEYAIWRENDEVKRIRIDQISQEKLNYKAAWAKAVGLIPQGIFSENNRELQARSLDAWDKGEIVAVEFDGLNGAKIVAFSNNNKPFELMLPEEWAERSKSLK